MLSHSHPVGFNIEVCCSCGENRVYHTKQTLQTVATKNATESLAIFWSAVSRCTHIKREADFSIFIENRGYGRAITCSRTVETRLR